jgi:hypothetical protein
VIYDLYRSKHVIRSKQLIKIQHGNAVRILSAESLFFLSLQLEYVSLDSLLGYL